MPISISLQKVNIAGFKYWSIVDGVKTEITADGFNNQPIGNTVHSKCIAFDTPSGELSDGQYAVQPNGFIWVKIPNYSTIKIEGSFIKNEVLSLKGIDYIKFWAEVI